MHHLADDGFQLGSGEPRPADFPPAAACMTSLTFRAVAVRRVEAHLGWDDLIAMVPNADGTAWDEGRVHRFDSGANAFWYGGLNIDAVTSASADLAEFVPTLLTLCDTLQTRCREADAAEKTLAQAMALELTERRQWYAQYRKDEGLLIAVYPTTKPFVDTFFKSPRKTKKKKPVTGGTGGEGTGGGE